jgi:hypothetical protein
MRRQSSQAKQETATRETMARAAAYSMKGASRPHGSPEERAIALGYHADPIARRAYIFRTSNQMGV